MNTMRMATCIVTMLLTLLGCSRPSTNERQGPALPAEEPVTFVNRVWEVAESSGMSPGQLVVFLSEGTLVFASTHGTPALGTWKYDGGSLTMIEEGLHYKVDILELSNDEFRIRSYNPGGFIDTRFVLAEGPPLATDRS